MTQVNLHLAGLLKYSMFALHAICHVLPRIQPDLGKATTDRKSTENPLQSSLIFEKATLATVWIMRLRVKGSRDRSGYSNESGWGLQLVGCLQRRKVDGSGHIFQVEAKRLSDGFYHICTLYALFSSFRTH